MHEPDHTDIVIDIMKMSTGERRTWQSDLGWDKHSKFLWKDGNFSCDCNRASFFRQAGGDEPSAQWRDCSDGEFRVVAIKSQTGQLLYSEEPA